MKKQFWMLMIVSLFCMSFANAEETVVPIPELVKLKKLSENVYAYIGIKEPTPAGNSYGANVGVVIGKDSVLVIDTLISAKQAQKLIADIAEITDKPIKYVVNTHSHLDHAWGNCEFAKLDAVIIGKRVENITEESVNQMIAAPEMFGLTAADMEGTIAKLADVDVEDDYTVDLGNVTVDIKYHGPAHTQDSLTVLVKEDNVLFLGDIVFNKYHPYLGDGDISNWIKILDKLGNSPAAIMVPGHGPAATKEDLKEMAIYLNEFDKQARILAEGKTQADVVEVADAILPLLPEQGRAGLPHIIQMNLNVKYLAPVETVQEEDTSAKEQY